MWSKTIIVDRTVKRIATRDEVELAQTKFAYAFSGYNPESKAAEWCSAAENVKLYDTVAEAVTVAIELQKELPVEVMTFSIVQEARGAAITVTTVKF